MRAAVVNCFEQRRAVEVGRERQRRAGQGELTAVVFDSSVAGEGGGCGGGKRGRHFKYSERERKKG